MRKEQLKRKLELAEKRIKTLEDALAKMRNTAAIALVDIEIEDDPDVDMSNVKEFELEHVKFVDCGYFMAGWYEDHEGNALCYCRDLNSSAWSQASHYEDAISKMIDIKRTMERV